MRNRTTMLLFGIGFAAYFIMFAFGPSRIVERPVVYDFVWFFVLALGLYLSILLEMFKTPKLFWYGGSTTIYQSEPVSTVKIVNPVNPEEEFEMGAFAHGGCRSFGIMGGGSKGYTWSRMDLVKTQPGNFANLKIDGIAPSKYMLHAGPNSGFKDLYGLPENMLDATFGLPNWSAKSIVLVNWYPAGAEPEFEKETGLPFQEMWEHSNNENHQLKEVNHRLMEVNVNLARTHGSVVETFAKKASRRADSGWKDEADEEH